MLRSVILVGVLTVVPAVASAQQPCTTDARQVVNEIYRHMLERAADPGSAVWVDKLASGNASVRELVRDIAKSPEHLQRFGNDARGVDTLYRHILGRQPDAAGQRAFADLANSRGLAAVVDQIVNSGEYQQSFGDWGVPGSGGVTYCAKGGTTSQNRNQPERNDQTRNQPDRNDQARTQPDRNDQARNQPDRGQPDRDPRYGGREGNESDRNGSERYPGERSEPDPRDRLNAGMRFRVLDTNNDRVISRREWTGDASSFQMYDWNRDGVLSGDEVSVYGVPPASMSDGRNRNIGRADRFDYLDTNGNHAIDRHEWDGGWDAFMWLDVNRDGRLTRGEFNNGASRALNFDTLDLNHDRRITLTEWPWSHRSFDEEDLNNDGAITRGEFRGDVGAASGRRF